MIRIEKLSNQLDLWPQVLDIFFESSGKKEFSTLKDKEEFIYKYIGFYKKHHSDSFFIAIREDSVLGYICGAEDSLEQLDLFTLLPHYKLFKDLYLDYSTHLHINLHLEARGAGVGSKLIKHFEEQTCGSIHLITTPSARNRSFYLKNGYDLEIIRKNDDTELLFMGKTM